MSTFIKKFGISVLSYIQPNYSPEKNFDASSFWTFFEQWMNTTHNSPEELACAKNIQRALGYKAYNKREILVAFYILQDATPLKEALLAEILTFKEIDGVEWEEAVATAREAFFSMDMIRR